MRRTRAVRWVGVVLAGLLPVLVACPRDYSKLEEAPEPAQPVPEKKVEARREAKESLREAVEGTEQTFEEKEE